jgi:hypothetical protein
MRSTFDQKEDGGIKDSAVLTNQALKVVKQPSASRNQPNVKNSIIKQDSSIFRSESNGTLPLNQDGRSSALH